jgi:hypothetical protein
MFQKGNQLGKGRPAGALNRSTEQAKLAVARLANSGLDALREDLEKIRKKDPIEAAKIYLKLIEYIVPKKSSIEMKAEIESRVQQITVNIHENGIKDTNN